MNHWGWPQYMYVAVVFVGLGFVLAKHGEPKEGKYSFWNTLIADGLVLWLLIAGGFFR